MGSGLTPEQVAAFQRDGYLVIRDALPASTVTSLLAETHHLLSSFSLTDHPMTRFSTGQGRSPNMVGDDYFLTSGDKVRFFFEEDAVDDQGRLTRHRLRAVNKIGHGLHMHSPPFRALLGNPAERGGCSDIAENGKADAAERPNSDAAERENSDGAEHAKVSPAAVVRTLGFRDPRCLQSMVICKQPEIGGVVPPHQDSSFLYTSPPSAVGFWYALEDATLENGCLSFLPGSHRWAPISKRLVRTPEAGGTAMVDNDGLRFPQHHESRPKTQHDDKSMEAYVPAEVKAGDLILIHGNLLHKSERNTSQKGRIIYTFHVIEADGTTYDERNWLQPPSQGFTKLYA